MFKKFWKYSVVLIGLLCTAWNNAEESTVIRVGHFPNITHSQAVIGHGLMRQEKGWFE